ncbi:MAG: hypothetical protein M1822_010043 [Bathelium mastoideum]|nr:MAG: hypothetical protein M1822_010043 [Bathelium mastoideum]
MQTLEILVENNDFKAISVPGHAQTLNFQKGMQEALSCLDLVLKYIHLGLNPNATAESFVFRGRIKIRHVYSLSDFTNWHRYLAWLDCISFRVGETDRFAKIREFAIDVAEIFIQHGADRDAMLPLTWYLPPTSDSFPIGNNGPHNEAELWVSWYLSFEQSAYQILDDFSNRTASTKRALLQQLQEYGASKLSRIMKVTTQRWLPCKRLRQPASTVLGYFTNEQQSELSRLAKAQHEARLQARFSETATMNLLNEAIQKIWDTNEQHLEVLSELEYFTDSDSDSESTRTASGADNHPSS